MEPEFKHHYGSIHAYLEQFVKTAAKGNIVIDYALHVARLRLSCKVCGETLTAAEPEGTSVSYGIQEFVKIHAHTGGHKDLATDPSKWPAAKAVTADFKPVLFTGINFAPLPPNAKAILKNIEAGSSLGATVIDDNPQKAAQIASQMQQYEKELAAKMTDIALANKIKILQMGDKEKAEAFTKLAQEALIKKAALASPEPEDIESAKAEVQALENILLIKQMMEKKAVLQGKLSGMHESKPPKTEKPLKIATGRKFR